MEKKITRWAQVRVWSDREKRDLEVNWGYPSEELKAQKKKGGEGGKNEQFGNL